MTLSENPVVLFFKELWHKLFPSRERILYEALYKVQSQESYSLLWALRSMQEDTTNYIRGNRIRDVICHLENLLHPYGSTTTFLLELHRDFIIALKVEQGNDAIPTYEVEWALHMLENDPFFAKNPSKVKGLSQGT